MSPTCARCSALANLRRPDGRALCLTCFASCAQCGRPRDTRHPAKSELCRICYRQALGALQRLVLNPTTRQTVLGALRTADRALLRAGRAEEGPTYSDARGPIADLRIALGDRP